MEKRLYWITLLLLFSFCYLGKATPQRLKQKDKTSISVVDAIDKKSTKKLSKKQRRKEKKLGLGLQMKLRLMMTFLKKIKKRKAKKDGRVKKGTISTNDDVFLLDSLTYQQIIKTKNYHLAKSLGVKNRVKTRSFLNTFRKRLKKMREKDPSIVHQKIAKKDLLGHLNNRALSPGEMAHYAGLASIGSFGLAILLESTLFASLSLILLGIGIIALIVGLFKGNNVGGWAIFLALGTWFIILAIIFSTIS